MRGCGSYGDEANTEHRDEGTLTSTAARLMQVKRHSQKQCKHYDIMEKHGVEREIIGKELRNSVAGIYNTRDYQHTNEQGGHS